MRAYILYKDKSIRGFKKLMNAGGGVFDKYRTQAVKFIRYASTELDTKIAEYDSVLGDVNSIDLENVFPKTYKWLISDKTLKAQKEYLKNLEGKITEFDGKEDNLKILVGVQFLRLVLVTKIVEMYLATVSEMKANGQDISNVSLKDLGIGKSTLKYFDSFEKFQDKSIDDWLNYKADISTAGYFYSAMKRILMILEDTE
jgi:hypothetical protein